MQQPGNQCDFHFHRPHFQPQQTRLQQFQQSRRSVGQSTVSPPGLGVVGSATLPRPRRPTPVRLRVPPPPPPPVPPPARKSTAQFDAAVTCLWLLTPLAAAAGAAVVTIAVSTNNWLRTTERMPNPAYNGTGDTDSLLKLTVSGLWTICQTVPGETEFNCTRINYFPREEYSPDPGDSTMAVPYAVTRSAFLLLLAAVLIGLGCFTCAMGYCARGRRICTFIAGVLFVVSGLVMLLGIVMYISIFKAEVGNKLKRVSVLQNPKFEYRYGYSFILYVSGFIMVEMAGTFAILLFLYWYQKYWVVDISQQHKYKAFVVSTQCCDNFGNPSCRKHSPGNIPPNMHPNHVYQQRRVALNRCPPTDPCTVTASLSAFVSPARLKRCDRDREAAACALHSSSSLRDVSKSSSSLYGFPVHPPSVHQQPLVAHAHVQTHQIDKDNVFHFSEEPPRSADTLSGLRSASIFQSDTLAGSCKSLHAAALHGNQAIALDHIHHPREEQYTPGVRYDQEFVRFDLERPAIEKRKSDSLRRTTPV